MASANPAPLTIQERILLHLASFGSARERYAAPKETTQTGIAAALGVRAGHVSREIHKLTDQGLVEERESAVEGSKRHQKAYVLSPAGTQAAHKLQAERGEAGAARQMAGAKARALDRVRIERDLPQARYFFGREAELEQARRFLEERAVLVIIGIAGIGKSTFGARLYEETARSRSVAWHGIREYDNAETILNPAARMLAALGRPRLEVLLKREGPLDLARAKDIVVQDSEGLSLALFVDDVQAAGPEALMAVRVLREAACERPAQLKLVLLSRIRPPVYDAREVALRKRVAELELGGLSREAVAALLSIADRQAGAENVFEMTAGHPLFVELVRDSQSQPAGGRHDPRHIDRFLNDEIFSKLSDGELALLRRVVFLRRWVGPRVVLESPATMQQLLALESRSILRRDSRGRVSIHEALREFARRGMPEEESARLSAAALRAVLRECDEVERNHDAPYALDLLECALELTPGEDDRARVLTRLAKGHFELMQYGAAIVRVEEAIGLLRKAGRRTDVLRLTLLLADIHNEAAHAAAAKQCIEEAERQVASLPSIDPALEGQLFLVKGHFEDAFGSPTAALEWLSKANKAARELSDRSLEAETELHFSHGTPAPESHTHLERCIELAQGEGNAPRVSFAHSVFAWHLIHFSGDLGAAMTHARAGLEVAQAIGNQALIDWNLVSIAKVHWRAGDLGQARATARSAMTAGDRRVSYQLYPLYLVSLIETDLGNAQEGERIARDLLRVAEEFDWSWAGAAPRRALAHALEEQGRPEEALPLFEASHAAYARNARLCDAGGDAVIVDRLIHLEAQRGNAARALEWKGVLEGELAVLEPAVAHAFRSMASGHLSAAADPREASARYMEASASWQALGWRVFALREAEAALEMARRARAAGAPWPEGVPEEDRLEEQLRRLEEELHAAATTL